MTVDHVNPKVNGGTNGSDNLYPSCETCNLFKGAMNLEQFRCEIARQIKKIRDTQPRYKLAEKYGLVKETGNPVTFWFERFECHD